MKMNSQSQMAAPSNKPHPTRQEIETQTHKKLPDYKNTGYQRTQQPPATTYPLYRLAKI